MSGTQDLSQANIAAEKAEAAPTKGKRAKKAAEVETTGGVKVGEKVEGWQLLGYKQLIIDTDETKGQVCLPSYCLLRWLLFACCLLSHI